MTILSPADLQQFKCKGYLIIEDFIDIFDIEQLRSQAQKLIQNTTPHDNHALFHQFFNQKRKHNDEYILGSSDQIRFFFEEAAFDKNGKLTRPLEQSLCKLGHALHDIDPVFDQFSRSPQIRELMQQLNYLQPLIVQSMYFFKNPYVGGEIALHQDESFIFTKPSSTVGLWFSLQPATIANGCLWVLPSGHLDGLANQFIVNDCGQYFIKTSERVFNLMEFIPLEVKEGSLILLHGELPHFSGKNTTAQSREAYTLHFIDGQYDYPKENWLQRNASLPFRGF